MTHPNNPTLDIKKVLSHKKWGAGYTIGPDPDPRYLYERKYFRFKGPPPIPYADQQRQLNWFKALADEEAKLKGYRQVEDVKESVNKLLNLIQDIPAILEILEVPDRQKTGEQMLHNYLLFMYATMGEIALALIKGVQAQELNDPQVSPDG